MYEFLGGRQSHYVEPIIFENEFEIDNLIVVYYNRFSPRFRFAGERHNFYEFYYVAENEMIVTIDNEKYLLKEGEFILVPPMRWHAMSPHETYATGYHRIVRRDGLSRRDIQRKAFPARQTGTF